MLPQLAVYDATAGNNGAKPEGFGYQVASFLCCMLPQLAMTAQSLKLVDRKYPAVYAALASC
jgi:hypothetical protein